MQIPGSVLPGESYNSRNNDTGKTLIDANDDSGVLKKKKKKIPDTRTS